jgi:hypothetical protein
LIGTKKRKVSDNRGPDNFSITCRLRLGLKLGLKLGLRLGLLGLQGAQKLSDFL